MSDLISDRYLSCREGLTVRQIKEHLADWPEEDQFGEPSRVLMSLMRPDGSQTLYVPVGEVTEVTLNGSTPHLMVLPVHAVTEMLQDIQKLAQEHDGTNHQNRAAE